MKEPDQPRNDAVDFETVVREIGNLAFAHGLKTGGLAFPSDGQEKKARFIAACHEGYALAQNRLIEELVKIEDELLDSKNNLKELRRSRDVNAIKQTESKIFVLENQRYILKKIGDGLAWTILRGELWKMRRFYLGEKPRYLRSTNLESVKRVVDERNKDKMRFALMTDLTSCIQVGDIIEISFADKHLNLIEVKEGVMNEKITDVLDSFSKTHCERIPYLFAKQESLPALKQLIRTVKQDQRMDEVVKVIRTGKGKDLSLNKQLFIPDKYYIEEDYFDEIREAANECKQKGFSIKGIDGCLLIGMFDQEMAHDSQLGFAHSIYHLKHPEAQCLLETTPERGREEIESIIAERYPVHDLIQGLRIPSAMPPFLWPVENELIMDIVFRRKVMLLYLDFEKMFQLASSFGIKCEWAERKAETNWKPKDFFSQFGKRPLLTKCGRQLLMGDGTLARIIFNGVRPASVLRMLGESLESSEFGSLDSQPDR